jgi:hypothetical protein
MRTDQLDVVVKGLGVQVVLKKDLNVDKFLTKEQAQSDVGKIKDDVKRAEELAKQMRVLSDKETAASIARAKAETEADIERATKLANAENQRALAQIEKAIVDNRLVVLETKLISLIGGLDGRLKALEKRG